MKLPVNASNFLPHKEGMLFIDSITEYLPGIGGQVKAKLSSHCIFASAEGMIDSTLCLELMAQGFAALEGYAAHTRNEPVQKGFLVGVQQLDIKTHEIRTGMPLTIGARIATRIDDFALIDCTISHGDSLIAEGTIKLYIPKESDD